MPLDQSLWAEHGGILGLVAFGLFVIVFWFIKANQTLTRENRDFVKDVMKDHREERKEDRKEGVAVQNRLADALDGLANQLRDSHKKD